MRYNLTYKDIFALGFMTFALFVGAGNIIFPPIIGLQSGEKVWIAATGFLITGVVLPITAVIALAKVGGGIDQLSIPIGKIPGLLLSFTAYIAIGPLFAVPRTATVSYEVGLAPLLSISSSGSLFIYNFIYFFIVIVVSFYPGKLLNSIGYILAPIKIIALAVLSFTALICPAGKSIAPIASYADMAFFNGFINGYMTMDTLGAMVFGIIIVNAARSRCMENSAMLIRYITWAVLIAGVLITLIYIALFKLGNSSGTLLPNASNGTDILHAYVQYIFGDYGSFFLGILIFISCIVTAIGLICACAKFFINYIPISYRLLVLIFSIFSMIISNLGLSNLIKFSIPVLMTIYPPCIILIIMSFTLKWWNNSFIVVTLPMLTSLLFGFLDAIKYSNFLQPFVFDILKKLPLYEYNVSWLIPTLIVLFFLLLFDYFNYKL
ncbi:Branched-chain amino acid transport system 2 carrier protein [Candidatus Arsenophonus lipoptenae]|uniref:Branched-chain amino acid transport system carrier protein n=1 Tax=Candidatus Arsenophonus lipoptenae TaxID=634113 RepID=A0A109QE24_9GAMM|nr:branched-chain amino acid transport system II carrier protein [Candidatus Arsenophonus lipoptenae]AMA64841.1 Branched-chain amino acid transport system 2 carrier protein [Candidatus Arsenophonus lipoptenae]